MKLVALAGLWALSMLLVAVAGVLCGGALERWWHRPSNTPADDDDWRGFP